MQVDLDSGYSQEHRLDELQDISRMLSIDNEALLILSSNKLSVFQLFNEEEKSSLLKYRLRLLYQADVDTDQFHVYSLSHNTLVYACNGASLHILTVDGQKVNERMI